LKKKETKAANGTADGARRSESGNAIRERIKAKATEMFIRRGFNGLTFLDLSKELDINHSLIHYHFGTKIRLAEEVLRDFAASGIQENQDIWENENTSLFDKFVAARDRMYGRFILFNPTGTMEKPTGLVSRFSLDAESLSPEVRRIVQDTHERLDQCVSTALSIALRRGELVADAPVHLLMLQISSILFTAGPTARYGWEFTRLDDHFRGTLQTIFRAFGAVDVVLPPWPEVKQKKKATRRKAEAAPLHRMLTS
jgi:AcrR family transcriptional regulator